MRAGKILLLLGVLTLGAALQTALAVRDNLSIGPFGCRVLGGRFVGPSFTFEAAADAELPAATPVRVDNAFGAVDVRAGEAGRVRVALRKVVFVGDEARARKLADEVRLTARLEDGELRVRTNRDELARTLFDGVGLETHLDVQVPPGTVVAVGSEHGPVSVVDAEAVRVQASFDTVRVERVAGPVSVKSRHGDVTVAGAQGAVEIESRHGAVEVRDAGGAAALDVQHGDVLVLGAGATTVQLRFGNLKAERVGGDLHVRGEHAGVTAAGVTGGADVETSFRDVHVERVQGDVRVAGQHGGVRAEEVGGKLDVRTSYEGVDLARITGPVEARVDHGGLRADGLAGGASVQASGDDVVLDGVRGPVTVVARRGSVTLTPAGPLEHDVSADVENGSFTLVVPAGSRGRVDARAEHGDVHVEDIPGLSVTAGDDKRAEGMLAGGAGGTLTLRTRHGDVRIVASEAAERSRGE